jgi:hypothetical protein
MKRSEAIKLMVHIKDNFWNAYQPGKYGKKDVDEILMGVILDTIREAGIQAPTYDGEWEPENE